MTTGMPELGSKISLISKADIRYEGRLFTVDPIECTIALASVRSYGTEDRETQYPIHPQNQVYEYILFRGSDIKDIRVINSVPVPNDPAIMQMHLPPAQQQFPNGQFAGNMPHMGTPMAGQPFNNIYSTMSSSFSGPNLAPGAGSMNKSKQSSELNIAIPEPSSTTQLLDQGSFHEMLSGGSRSTTPTSRKSPAHDSKPNQSRNEQGGNNSQRDNSRRGNRNKSQQRERKDSTKNDQVEHKTPQRNQQFHGNNQRNWNNNRGNNNQMRGNRPRGRGMNQQAFTQSLQNNKGRAKTKFRNDYDFEEANKKFENMCLKGDNVKVGEEAIALQTNGEVDKKDDSGNETGAGEHEVEEDHEVGVGYDKTKSFFDNISCEAATDRTKGKAHKDWHQERKINSETFGPSARRGGFFNYRGRGGFYNRNSMNPGGYRGNMNYNRGGSYRPFNRNFNSNSTGIPQQSNKPEQSEAPAAEAAAGN
ncbi:protein LSM14 homolog A isoform X1 [Bradysia coprophila]|uniref:protein LSM14 homolog A isoform X1 n=1 Tax=Bradysia coprophila TaxID=38358 RepID=UPI00187DAE39|nr:protein LSM14 homolog A isoform X1 [Bradysia coprophila]